MNANQIVSSWLNGTDSAGMANPAGPLFADGQLTAQSAGDGAASILMTRPIFCDVSTSTGTCFG